MNRVRALAILTALAASSLACAGTGRVETWKAAQSPVVGVAGVDRTDVTAGDKLWLGRDDRSALEGAIAAWERAVAVAPNDADTLVKLARARYFLADGFLRGDLPAYLASLEQGVAFAERALAAASPAFAAAVKAGDPVIEAVEEVGAEGVPGLYWYATNLGKWSKGTSFTVMLANKDTYRAAMERCLALDPAFFHGGPDRYFGAFYAVAPSFAGGDLAKSEEHFHRALAAAPNYLATKVLMAENLAVKRQDRALYERLLNEVLAASDDVMPGLEPETRVEKQKASALLKLADETF
jgi:tetratricopeptide (TPR) repeat protein